MNEKILYEVNNYPTTEKIEKYDKSNNIFYRFQMKDLEMGTKSWLIHYSNQSEALESCELDGLKPEEAILDGKSACSTAKELTSWSYLYYDDFRVLVLNGDKIGIGHDGEDVVDVSKIIEVWDFNDFIKLMTKLKEQ